MEVQKLIGIIAAALVLVTAAAAAADKPDLDALEAQGAQALLEALDQRHNGYPTQHWKFEMKVRPKDGDARVMTFEVWQKGSKRLVRFLSPGEVKGMSVLSKGTSAMWVYSSQTGGKPRRVGSSAKRQNLLGSDMSYDDMSQVNFSPVWDASITGKDAGSIWLDLVPRPDGGAAWTRLRLAIDRKDVMIKQVEYYDGSKLVKTQKRTGFEMLDGVPVYRQIRTVDAKSGHQTILTMLMQKIGEDLSDRLFSKRTLVRGN